MSIRRRNSAVVFALMFITWAMSVQSVSAAIAGTAVATKIGDDVVLASEVFNTSGSDYLVYDSMGVKAAFTWPGDKFTTPWNDELVEPNEAKAVTVTTTEHDAQAGTYLITGSFRYFSSSTYTYLPNKSDNVTVHPPSNLNVTWAVGSCHTCNCTEWNAFHSATNADRFVIESGYSSTGPWTFYSQTSGGRSNPHVPIDNMWFRIRAENTAGATPWQVRYLADWCDCNTPDF